MARVELEDYGQHKRKFIQYEVNGTDKSIGSRPELEPVTSAQHTRWRRSNRLSHGLLKLVNSILEEINEVGRFM